MIVESPVTGISAMPGAADHVATVGEATHRYVLGDDVARVCADLIFQQTAFLASCTDLVRAPAGTFWLEWTDGHMAAADVDRRAHQHRRAGMLVCADATGRRGRIQTFWAEPEGGDPIAAPGSIEFDFDEDLSRLCDKEEYWPLVPPRSSPLDQILSHVRLRLEPCWLDYYRRESSGPGGLAKTLAQVSETLWVDPGILSAFSILLALKSDVRLTKPDLTKLNAARRKRGKPDLMDYVEVSASIFRPEPSWRLGDHGGRSRARLHHVRGHFVRRKNNIFWRSAHMRGDAHLGAAPRKTVHLSLGQRP
jgi:hypothetical protein